MRIPTLPLARVGRAALLVAFVAGFALAGSQATPVRAAGITVTTLVDETTTNGLCSLREAMANANADAAVFPDCPAGTGDDTITFAVDGDIVLTGSLGTVTAGGPMTIDGVGHKVTLSGGGLVRVLDIGGPATVPMTVRNLTITHGKALGAGGNGGGIRNSGSLIVENSTFFANTASFDGGAISNQIGGVLVITNTTIFGNDATNGGGFYNSTAAATLTNVTVAGNTAGAGGGIMNVGGSLIISNSLVADNSAAPGPDCLTGGSSIGTPGPNMFESTAGCIVIGTPVTVADPKLGVLADNGGPTMTQALLAGSPAYDAGSATICAAAPVSGKDQRGATRPTGPGCELGAWEGKLTIGGRNMTISTGEGELTSIELTWDGGNVQTAYSLLKYNTATTAASLIPIGGGETSYSDTSISTSVVYCYALAATNASGFLGLSDLLCGMTGMRIGTVLPVDFALGLKQSPMATMTWTAPAGGADSYLLQAIPLDGSPVMTVPIAGGITTFTSPPLSGAGACFQLIAFKSGAFGTTNVLCGLPGFSSIPGGGPSSLSAAEHALRSLASAVPAALPQGSAFDER